jgi:hypothetical protein
MRYPSQSASVSPLDDRVDLSGEDRPALDQHIGKLM